MRKNLLESFDKIYILDLHGNSKKKETCPDGSIDQNVFDIMQGVSINIFIKTGKKKKNELGKVYHFDLYGKRNFKYDFLSSNLKELNWKILNLDSPYYFFVPKNFDLQAKYEEGFQVEKLFSNYNSGIQTKCDEISIHFTDNTLRKTVLDFQNLQTEILKSIYNFKSDSSGWNFENASTDLRNNPITYTPINFRPFDIRQTIHTGKSSGFIGRPRASTMNHFINKENIGLLICRQAITEKFGYFITDKICDINFTGSAGQYGAGLLFPLYIYPENIQQQTLDNSVSRIPNLNPEIIKKIAENLNISFTNEKETTSNICFTNNESRPEFQLSFAPIDLLDYIYAILHSPHYRETYKEFLKIDFPRIPTPSDPTEFTKLVKLGGELRQIHLLESSIIENYITTYPEDGDNIVTKVLYKNGNVFINETQFFSGVPEVTWNFYVGGYQPAQKWLKDRKDRELNFDDIFHYQKIIVALTETDRIMKEIDKILKL
jgi:predicted helicase